MPQHVLAVDAWNEQVDAYVAELNARVGLTGAAPLFTGSPMAFPMVRTHITPDLFSLWARTTGDTNPLWSDAGYAAASPWGGVIAPPVVEACLAESASQPAPAAIPGWLLLQGGSLRRYDEPFRPGDVIRGEDVWHGVEEKTRPGRPYRLFIQRAERRYINQADRVVASLISRIAVTAVPPAEDGEVPGGPDLAGRGPRRYSAEEQAQIRLGYEQELSGRARRGAEPRFWEEVEVGEKLPEQLKGPYDISDAVAAAGAMGICPAFAPKWEEIAPVADVTSVDPDTGAPHHGVDWHFDASLSRTRGFPAPPAFGTQLEGMLTHAVTNWMSDHGFLTECDFQLHSPLLQGEVSRTTGTVVGKRRDGERHLVDVEVRGETLDRHPYAKARITVDLPARDGYSPARPASADL
ncbi:MaoC family dehydratase N-terminal domain-containing protein [Streptomyces sp. NPDC048002]|uniref:FAS1-like dehydratase domain-containing protein n=1 Tax=Streptomyces sp. NPDC048002 TaxID=3154344 RepID=UPI0033FB0552